VVVTTDKFADLARQDAEHAGLSDARIVTARHPIGGVSAEIVDRRADQIVEATLGLLIARHI